MKKIFKSITILLFVGTICNAQNTSPYWSLAGNSNATSSSKLGTTNGINLRIFTNNAERIRVTTSGLVGINTTAPNSRLHINSTTGQNPLRCQVNGATKFFVDDLGGVTIGSTTTPPANGLYVSGSVGIGTASPSYKLHSVSSGTAIYGNSTAGGFGVFGQSTSTGVYGTGGSYGVEGYAPGGTGFGYGVFGHSSYTGVTGSGGSYGVSGYCTSTSSGFGVYGSATDNASGIGVYGQGYYGVKAISNTLYGVDGTGYYIGVIGHGSTSNSFSYGVEGYGVYQGGYFTGGSYGVQGYASSSGGTGVYGSTASGGYAGYFSGTVFATTYAGSDRKLKKNIEDVSTALNIIKQLHPKVYEFRQDGSYKYMHLSEGKHYGLIAQELEQVLPTLVKDSRFDTRVELQAQAKAAADGAPNSRNAAPQGEVIDFKAVNYTELIPILIKAMQELNAEKDKQINDLQSQINELKSLTLKGGNSTSVSSVNGFLKQNVPNPVNENTVIGYYIPDNAGHAQIRITDIKGSVLKSFNAAKGDGQLNIKAGELAAGTYNYILYINDKKIDTKQMVLLK